MAQRRQLALSGTGFFMADQRTPYPLDLLPGPQALKGTRVRQLELFLRSPTGPNQGAWQSINASPLRTPGGEISGAVIVSRDTTILREASLEILKNNRDRGLLHQVAAAANQWSDVERVLREALAAITDTTGWPLGHVHLRQGDRMTSSTIWVGAQREAHAAVIAATEAVPSGHRLALVDAVVQSGRLRFVSDLQNESDPLRKQAFQASGLGAGVFVPVAMDGLVVAVLQRALLAPRGPACARSGVPLGAGGRGGDAGPGFRARSSPGGARAPFRSSCKHCR